MDEQDFLPFKGNVQNFIARKTFSDIKDS